MPSSVDVTQTFHSGLILQVHCLTTRRFFIAFKLSYISICLRHFSVENSINDLLHKSMTDEKVTRKT